MRGGRRIKSGDGHWPPHHLPSPQAPTSRPPYSVGRGLEAAFPATRAPAGQTLPHTMHALSPPACALCDEVGMMDGWTPRCKGDVFPAQCPSGGRAAPTGPSLTNGGDTPHTRMRMTLSVTMLVLAFRARAVRSPPGGLESGRSCLVESSVCCCRKRSSWRPTRTLLPPILRQPAANRASRGPYAGAPIPRGWYHDRPHDRPPRASGSELNDRAQNTAGSGQLSKQAP